MAEDGRKQAFGVGAGQGELVSMADTSRLYLNEHLAGLGAFELDLRDDERLGFLQCDGGAGFHGGFLLVILVIQLVRVAMAHARGKSPPAMEPDRMLRVSSGPHSLPQTS